MIETAGTLSAAEVREALEANGRAEVVMAGEITATCPKKGCWMDVASGEDTVFVRFLTTASLCPPKAWKASNGMAKRFLTRCRWLN